MKWIKCLITINYVLHVYLLSEYTCKSWITKSLGTLHEIWRGTHVIQLSIMSYMFIFYVTIYLKITISLKGTLHQIWNGKYVNKHIILLKEIIVIIWIKKLSKNWICFIFIMIFLFMPHVPLQNLCRVPYKGLFSHIISITSPIQDRRNSIFIGQYSLPGIGRSA